MTIPKTGIKLRSPVGLSQLPPQILALVSSLDHSLQESIKDSINIIDYALGDTILIYTASEKNCSENNQKGHRPKLKKNAQKADGDSDVIGILCQGSVRILIHNGQKEITAKLLRVDESFGGDLALINHPFDYRAVAASRASVALIPLSLMKQAFEASPQLQDYCREQAQMQERLSFFRLRTPLRNHSSKQLSKWVPYLQEITINAGKPLANITPAENGRYWLRSGIVQTQSNTSQPNTGNPNTSESSSLPPAVGESWGYATSQLQHGKDISSNAKASNATEVSHDWLAQSDLTIYHLPMSAWTVAKAFTADLDITRVSDRTPTTLSAQERSQTPFAGNAIGTIKPSLNASNHHQSNGYSGSNSGKSASLVQRAHSSSPQDVHNTHQASASAVIFPKPPQRILLDKLRHYPWIAQQSSSDCGAACLSMCARYWGKRFPLHVLRERANVGQAGASLKGLARAAEEIGFHARPVRASIGALASQKNPWIAHWEGIHYVVVYQVTDRKVIIADPAEGRKVISRQLFAEKWTGFGLLLDPTNQLQATDIKQASLGRYIKALLPYKALIAQIVAISLLIQCFSLITPLFTQVILDRVVVQKSTSTLNVFAIGLLVFGIWSLIMTAARQYLLSYFSNRLDLTLVSGFIRHVMSLPMRFFETRRVGDILTRVQENQKIQQFLIGQVVLAWLNLITGFVYLALMLHYNWQLTLLVLMMVPPIVIITLGSTPFLRRVSREVFKEAADQNSALVEMVSGISTVKSTAVEQEMRWRWEENLTRQMNARFKGQKLGIGLQGLSGTVNSVGSTLLLWYGATLVIQGQLSIGQFVAFNMMIGYVINPVVALAGLWDELQEVLISVERLNDVFESPVESARGGMTLPPLRGEVCFDNVTFRYSEEDDRNTLQNISLFIETGKTVAIVGRSGSGKSTLVKLLEGLYLPDNGRILIDGHDISHIEPASLRSQLGVVPQECFLFSGTILENLTLHRENISLEAAVKAAKLAEAHAFIQALPMGYQTKVGERGATLSGGQRQRIAIARALLGHPRILILDEATSSLDTESERHFQKNLERISQACTTFIIAHRLSTVRNADWIVVLDRGVIAEQGTHAQLVDKQGIYYSLAQQQLDL